MQLRGAALVASELRRYRLQGQREEDTENQREKEKKDQT